MVSQDWDKIREDHKEENRSEYNKKLVDRICELWKEGTGCDANSAMIHKWIVVDKGYEGPNAGPEIMVNFYKQASSELEGKHIDSDFV